MGLAPGQAREGDILCVVSGAHVPCTIHETTLAGQCILIGEVMAGNSMYGKFSTINLQSRNVVLV